ncbi:MAG TPA: hypothetical protein VFV23_00525 [Verrucomicrobiae bacterium]|nr:hypothetical protein [Verrucomicrobiae bacterium]
MKPRAKKILLLLLTAALLFGSGRVQNSLNRDRATLGLTISEPLQNAPPVLAFTTVALGGFRGLISNYLWIRANDLQIDDKYFEAVQLAHWITDLEPHFSQVWAYQAWNMAFNISVKFKDPDDRWRWVNDGVSLLRDEGLRYNPDDVLIHHELAWFFQFKMGQTMDDANNYYKSQWAKEMTPFFGLEGTNFEALVNPQTPEEKTNALILREKFKIDPVFAQKINQEWGPLDWRLPEAHAIYWASQGLQKAAEHPDKVKKEDLLQLRRVIYQSLLQTLHHGRILSNPFTQRYALGPNLDIIPQTEKAYELMIAEDPNDAINIARAYRYALCDAVYFLYVNNRIAEAAKWYKTLQEKFPDKPLPDIQPATLPKDMTLDEFAVARVQSEVGDTSQERTTAVVQGLLANAYSELALGSEDRAAGYKLLARKVYDSYQNRIKGGNNLERIGLPPWNMLNQTVISDLLNPEESPLPYAARAVIRSQLGMKAETNAPSVSTNAATSAISSTATNMPANAVTNAPIK